MQRPPDLPPPGVGPEGVLDPTTVERLPVADENGNVITDAEGNEVTRPMAKGPPRHNDPNPGTGRRRVYRTVWGEIVEEVALDHRRTTGS